MISLVDAIRNNAQTSQVTRLSRSAAQWTMVRIACPKVSSLLIFYGVICKLDPLRNLLFRLKAAPNRFTLSQYFQALRPGSLLPH
jgi:hypothetical protein